MAFKLLIISRYTEYCMNPAPPTHALSSMIALYLHSTEGVSSPTQQILPFSQRRSIFTTFCKTEMDAASPTAADALPEGAPKSFEQYSDAPATSSRTCGKRRRSNAHVVGDSGNPIDPHCCTSPALITLQAPPAPANAPLSTSRPLKV
eukprot:3941553-Rhodomonas_salina.1